MSSKGSVQRGNDDSWLPLPLGVEYLPDLEEDTNGLEMVNRVVSNIEYCSDCRVYMVPSSHVCGGPNHIIWPQRGK